MRYFVILGLLAALPGATDATGCRARARVIVQHAAPVVVQQAAVIQYAAVAPVYPVAIPAYSAAYGGDSYSGMLAAIQESMDASVKPLTDAVIDLQKQQAATRADLAAVRGALRPGPVPAPAIAPAPAPKAAPREPVPGPQSRADVPGNDLVIYQQSCSKCHDARVSDEKGGGLALLRGNTRLPLTDWQRAEVMRRTFLPPTEKGHMPKGGEDLSDAQYRDLVLGLPLFPRAAVTAKATPAEAD